MNGAALAYGVDSMQALQEALSGIRVTLERSGKRFSWVGGAAAELSFPKHVPWGFGVRFAKRLDRLIDSETDAFAKSVEKRTKRHLRR